MYVIFIKLSSKYIYQLIEYLKRRKIQTNIHYMPLHLHPYYKKLGFKNTKGKFDNSEKYFFNGLSLPIHPNLKNKDQKLITNLINAFFKTKNK